MLVVRSIPEPPEGWLQKAFAGEGADAVLIFDGVDEVPVGKPRDDLLAGLTNLETLYLSSTQVADLSPLQGLTNLQALRGAAESQDPPITVAHGRIEDPLLSCPDLIQGCPVEQGRGWGAWPGFVLVSMSTTTC
jgi:hypothetical protein